jgi:glycosyltransferase involved in cell wall biosynthesis
MRILLIPIERAASGTKTGDWHAAIRHLLGQQGKVVGITRPRWGTLKGKRKIPVLCFFWLLSFLYGLVARYDIIYCVNTPSAVVGMVLGAIRRRPFVWDAGNPALFNPGKLQWLMYWCECKVYARAHSVRMISTLYRDLYESTGMQARAVVIPHLINLAAVTPPAKHPEPLPRHVLFIGQGNTPSNQWALRYLNSIATFVKLQGKAEIWATGKPIEGAESIKFLGYVPDIYRTIHEADLCVVPVWQWVPSAPVPSTRVTDFMACGKCVVTTPYLQDVIPELQSGENCLIAQTPAQFLGMVLYALDHPQIRARLGNKARNLIVERYAWERAAAGIAQLLA